jgi:hypothetical protein
MDIWIDEWAKKVVILEIEMDDEMENQVLKKAKKNKSHDRKVFYYLK